MIVYSVTLSDPFGHRATNSDGEYKESLYTTREMAQKKANILNLFEHNDSWTWKVEEKEVVQESVEPLWFYGSYYPLSGELYVLEGCTYEDLPDNRRMHRDVILNGTTYDFAMPYDESIKDWNTLVAYVRDRYELVKEKKDDGK